MSFVPSRHNLIGPFKQSDRWYIINPLSGEADVLDAAEAQQLRDGSIADPAPWVSRGYLVDPAEEASRLRSAYLDFIDAREQDEVQLLFAVTMACNFGCDYCFQEDYGGGAPGVSPEVVDAFWRFVDTRLAGRDVYLTLFGGEPLLPNSSVRAGVRRLIEGAVAREIEIAVVTNGYHLPDALPLLTKARVREVQITLDGPAAIHDARRPLKGGGSTFARVAAAVEAALGADLPVNLRVVIDKDNLPHLPALADYAIAHGWTRHPRFKTQLGRNYELHSCQVSRSRLYTRIEMYEDLTALAVEHPQVLEFHRPAYHLARYLADENALPSPLFDACPGTKTEWAFDHRGHVYPCTANVGKPGEAIGTYWPSLALDQDELAEWEDRDVLAISACQSCPVQLVCGGGCAEVARNKTGSLHSPDCRPAAELVQLGMNLYLPQAQES